MKDISPYLYSDAKKALKTILKQEKADNPVIIVGSIGLIIHGVLTRTAGDIDVLTKSELKILNDDGSEKESADTDYPPGVFENITRRNKIELFGFPICNFIKGESIDLNEYEEHIIMIDNEVFKVKVQKLPLIIKHKNLLKKACGLNRALQHKIDLVNIKCVFEKHAISENIL